MSGGLKGAAALALLAGDLPHEQRLAILAPFFDPKPGQSVEVDARDLRDFGKGRTNPLNLRGFIHIKPPKNNCLTITRNLDESDDKICTPKSLSFTLGDLTKNGMISWVIKTHPQDFGTELTWKTPYRMAVTVPAIRKHKDSVDYKLIARCKAQRDPPLGRKITLEFFDGDSWIIDFPEIDELLPQPESTPNLYIALANSKKGIPKEKAKEDKDSDGTATDKSTSTATGTQVATTKGEGEAADQMEDRALWGIPARNSYNMEGYRFMPFGTTTKWFKGHCRYTYLGAQDDPQTGRLECHDVDGFDEVNMPLTCLKELR